MPGENLDLSSDPNPEPSGPPGPRPQQPGSQPAATSSSRRFVGVQFACCGVYSRIYVNRDSTAYEGNCPKCSKPVRLRIGPGGVDTRFFTAY